MVDCSAAGAFNCANSRTVLMGATASALHVVSTCAKVETDDIAVDAYLSRIPSAILGSTMSRSCSSLAIFAEKAAAEVTSTSTVPVFLKCIQFFVMFAVGLVELRDD